MAVVVVSWLFILIMVQHVWPCDKKTFCKWPRLFLALSQTVFCVAQALERRNSWDPMMATLCSKPSPRGLNREWTGQLAFTTDVFLSSFFFFMGLLVCDVWSANRFVSVVARLHRGCQNRVRACHAPFFGSLRLECFCAVRHFHSAPRNETAPREQLRNGVRRRQIRSPSRAPCDAITATADRAKMAVSLRATEVGRFVPPTSKPKPKPTHSTRQKNSSMLFLRDPSGGGGGKKKMRCKVCICNTHAFARLKAAPPRRSSLNLRQFSPFPDLLYPPHVRCGVSHQQRFVFYPRRLRSNPLPRAPDDAQGTCMLLVGAG